jgi:hypothetical protein
MYASNHFSAPHCRSPLSQNVIIKLRYLNFLEKQALGWLGTCRDQALAGGAE